MNIFLVMFEVILLRPIFSLCRLIPFLIGPLYDPVTWYRFNYAADFQIKELIIMIIIIIIIIGFI